MGARNSKPSTITLIAAAISLLLIAAVFIFFLVLNRTILPNRIEAQLHGLEEHYGIVSAFDKVRYRPFSTLRVSGLEFALDADSFAFPFSVGGRIEQLRLQTTLKSVLAGDPIIEALTIKDVTIRIFPEAEPSRPVASAETVNSGSPSVETLQKAPTRLPKLPAIEDYFDRYIVRLVSQPLFPEQGRVENLTVVYEYGDDPADEFALNLTSVEMTHAPDQANLTALVAGELSGAIDLDYSQPRLSGSLKGKDFTLSELVAAAAPRYTDNLLKGFVSFDLDFTSPVRGLAEMSGAVELSGLSLSHRALGETPLSDIDLAYDFELLYDKDVPLPPPRILGRVTGSNPAVIAEKQTVTVDKDARGELRVKRGEFTVNGLRAEFLPAVRGLFIEQDDELMVSPNRFELRIALPPSPVQALFSALPLEISAPFAGMELDGTVAWNLDLEVPLDKIAAMNWTTATELQDFSVEKLPARFNVYRLNDSFKYKLAADSKGRGRYAEIPAARAVSLAWKQAHTERTNRQIERADAFDTAGAAQPELLGSGGTAPFGEMDSGYIDSSYRYVRLEDISPWVVKAVLTAEDGDFYFHSGINWYSLKNAIERNILAGEIELGASTLSMQLVKNLFLTQDRAFSRKLYETFLVYLMEQDARISKERILELYLNIVDFGPDLYGIDAASRYYFGKDSSRISAGEAVWLASILPSPRRYHAYYAAGAISPGWFEHMKSYMDIMLERGRMSEEEHARAVVGPPVFSP